MLRAFASRRVLPKANAKLAYSQRQPLVFGYSRRLLTTQQYHEIADETLDKIVNSYETLIEQVPELDVDLSQGVLTLVMPDIGTYVINKQPPNNQIWLASPVSGPKRYDWVNGKWEYSRDQSTLGALLKKETEEALNKPLDLDLD